MEVTFHGKNKHYYEYDGEVYTATFPALWAHTHLPGTGPKWCGNCRESGTWNGVFIGYCFPCAVYAYYCERGAGFIMKGDECLLPKLDRKYVEYVKNPEKAIRATDTYLYGICLDDIGDTKLEDSRLLVEEEFKNYESDSDYFDFTFKEGKYELQG